MSKAIQREANMEHQAWSEYIGMQSASAGEYARLATNTETVYAAMYETVMAHDERKRDDT